MCRTLRRACLSGCCFAKDPSADSQPLRSRLQRRDDTMYSEPRGRRPQKYLKRLAERSLLPSCIREDAEEALDSSA